MKILLVIDQFDSGNNGTTISAQRFAQALRERGHEVRALAGGEPAPDKFAVPNLHFGPLIDDIITSQGMQIARPDRQVIEQAVAWADVLHFMLPFMLAHYALKEARRQAKPCTAAFHVQPENITSTLHMGKRAVVNSLLYTGFRDIFYNHFTHIHCPSEFIAGQLRQHRYTAQLHVISNGVSPEFQYRKAPKPPEMQGKFLVLMIGRLSIEKRQDVLLDAVAKSAHAQDIQLLLAGQGPRRKALEKQGAKLPNPPIFGFYSNRELCALLAMCDLYVHAADAEIEAIACIEALASGLVPIIAASPLSATPQFALDGRSLFAAGDSGDLAAKLDWWYEHPAERAEMEKEYARSAERYRLQASAQKAEEMFRAAIEEGAASVVG